MTSHVLFASSPAQGRTRARRLTLAFAAGCALAAAVATLAVLGLVRLVVHSDGPATSTAYDGTGFHMTLPHGWHPLTGAKVARVPGHPVAVIRRADGRGVVVVRQIPALNGDLRTVAKSLTAQLKRKVAGFQLVSARLGRVRAGGAFLYTFVRGGGVAVQSLAITTVHGRTFRIDSIVPAKETAAAREAGAIVRSFGR
jgi:hypothetical protein